MTNMNYSPRRGVRKALAGAGLALTLALSGTIATAPAAEASRPLCPSWQLTGNHTAQLPGQRFGRVHVNVSCVNGQRIRARMFTEAIPIQGIASGGTGYAHSPWGSVASSSVEWRGFPGVWVRARPTHQFLL